MLDSQELELRMAMSYYVGSENPTWVLWNNVQCSYPLSHLSSPRFLAKKRVMCMGAGEMTRLLEAVLAVMRTETSVAHNKLASSIHLQSEL